MTVYYIDPAGGSDALNGQSLANAFRTMAKAATVVNAGDTVNLLATADYDESVAISRSGTISAPIVWQAYDSGSPPTLAGATGTYPILDIPGRSYNHFKYINFTWKRASPVANKRFPWIRLLGTSTVGNEFHNCRIERPGTDDMATLYASGWDEWGFVIDNAVDTYIFRCTILGTSQGIQLKNHDLRTVIAECTIGPTIEGNITLTNSQSILRRARIINNTFEGAYVEDCIQFLQDLAAVDPTVDTSNWGTYIGSNVFRNSAENAVDLKGAAYCVVEGNIAYGQTGSNAGITEGGANRNSMFCFGRGAHTSSKQVIFRKNIAYANPMAFSANGSGWHIYNNTAVNNNRDYSGCPSTLGSISGRILWAAMRHDSSVPGSAFKNNICDNHTDADYGLRFGLESQVDCDYNCVTESLFWDIDTATTYNLATWRTALNNAGWVGGNDAHTIVKTHAEIEFVNVPTDTPTGVHTAYDFGLAAGSDCKGAGGPLTTTVGTGTDTTAIRVKDAGYFWDGWGIVEGDTVTVASQVRTILSVDYANNEFAVDEPTTYTAGQNVHYGNSTTPDIGAPAFQQTGGTGGGGGGGGAAGSGAAMVTRFAAATVTGNQTITLPATMTNAPKVVKFIVTSATADNTATANGIMSIGFAVVASSVQWSWGMISQDAVNPSNENRRVLDACCMTLSNTGTIDGQASIVSSSTTDVVINWTNAPGAAYLITMVAYDCAEAYAVDFAVLQNVGQTTTISPGFEFDLLFLFCHGRNIPNNFSNARGSYGVATYDGSTLKQFSWDQWYQDNVTPTVDNAQLSQSYAGGEPNAGGGLGRGILLSVSGTNIIATTSVGNWGDVDVEAVALCMRFNNLRLYAGIISTPTVTGNTTFGDPSFAPSFIEMIMTLTEAVNTGYSDGKAGAWGVAVADTTRSYSVAIADEDNQATSNAQSLVDDQLVNLPLHDGTTGIVATLTDYQSSGPRINFANVTATPKKWLMIALEQPTGYLFATGEAYSEGYGTLAITINLAATGESDSEGYGGLTIGLTVVNLAATGESYSEGYGEILSTTPTLISVIRPTRTYPDGHGLSIHVHEPLLAGSGFVMDISDQVSNYEHEIAALGGFWMANIKIVDRQGRLEDWFERGLSRRIITYSPEGRIVWDGFVNRITLNLGGLTKSVGPVLNVSNKTKLVYSFIDSGSDVPILGIRADTGWTQDTTSQGKWGILERVLSTGGATPDTAESLRDDYLRENAQPETDEDQNIGGTLSEPQIDLECLGFVHYLQTYTYNSTTTGITALSTKLAAVLAAEPNSFISHSAKLITSNALLVAAYDNDDRIAWNVVKELVSKGDASDNRYLFGVYADRVPQYTPVVDQVDYLQYLSDPEQKVTDAAGAHIAPWDVLPGKWIFAPDFLIGRVPNSAALRDDQRMEFIESVTYRAPWQLALRGSKVRRLDQKLAKLGLSGIGG